MSVIIFFFLNHDVNSVCYSIDYTDLALNCILFSIIKITKILMGYLYFLIFYLFNISIYLFLLPYQRIWLFSQQDQYILRDKS